MTSSIMTTRQQRREKNNVVKEKLNLTGLFSFVEGNAYIATGRKQNLVEWLITLHSTTEDVQIEDLVGPLQAAMQNVMRVAEKNQEQGKIKKWVESTTEETIADTFIHHLGGDYEHMAKEIQAYASLLESIRGDIAEKLIGGLKKAEEKAKVMQEVPSKKGKDAPGMDFSMQQYDKVCQVNGQKVMYNARELLALTLPLHDEPKSFIDAKKMKMMNPTVNGDVIERYVSSRAAELLPREMNYKRDMMETTFEKLQEWARTGDLVIKTGAQRTVHNDRTVGDIFTHFGTNVTIAVRVLDDNGRKRWELQDGYNTASQFGASIRMDQPNLSDEFEGFTLSIDDSGLQRCTRCRIFMDIYDGPRDVVEPIIANMKKAKAQPQGNQHGWEENTGRLSFEQIGPPWMWIAPAERYALQMRMAVDEAAKKKPSVFNGTFAYFHQQVKSEAVKFLKDFEIKDTRLETHDVCFRYVLYTILVYYMKGSDVCHKFDDATNHVSAWFSQIVTCSGKDVLRMSAQEIECEMAEAGKSAADWKYSLVLAAKAFRRLQNLFPPMLCLRMSNVIADMMFAVYDKEPKTELTGSKITVFCEVAAICKWKQLSSVAGVTPEVVESLTAFPWEKFDQGSPSLDNPSYRFHIRTCAQHINAFTPEVCASIHTIFQDKGSVKVK